MARAHGAEGSNGIGLSSPRDTASLPTLNPDVRSADASEDRSKTAITGMQDASASLNDLVRIVEKYGIICNELQKLCQKLGLQCQPGHIEETFQRIQKLFVEWKQLAESERLQRHESQSFVHQLRQTLDRMTLEKSECASHIHQQEQQIRHQTERIHHLEAHLKQTKQEMQNLEHRLIQDLEDERTNRSEMQKAYLDAENKAVEAECARRRSELSCQDAIAALDHQQSLCLQSQQEKEMLKQQIIQLDHAKKEVEKLYDDFYAACEGLCGDRDDLSTLLILERKRRDANASFRISPASLSPIEGDSETDQGSSEKLHDLFQQNGLMPPSTSHSDHPSIYHYTIQGSHGGWPSCLQEIKEAESSRHRPRRCSTRRRLPQSVVSGQDIQRLIGHRNMDGCHVFVSRTPIDAAHLVIQSESSDSAEDPGGETVYGHGAERVHSYDYGGSSTLPTSSEDYDSIRGSNEGFGMSNGMNPLIWLWDRKTNWMGGVRSGVSTAAKSGAKMSKSMWTWAVVAAVTVGGVGMNRTGLMQTAYFETSDSEDGDADEDVDDSRVDYFMG